jgi:cytochrome b561
LGRHVGLSSADTGFWLVRSATDLAGEPRTLRPAFFVHSLMGIAIACLAAAHIGAALYHHFVRKDRVLMRMITG